MPTFEVKTGKLENAKVEVLAIGAFAAPSLDDDADDTSSPPPTPVLGAGAEELAGSLGVDLTAELRTLRFDGSAGSVARITTRGAVSAGLLLVVGLGKEDDLDEEAVRRAAAAIAGATTRSASLATDLPGAAAGLDPADAAAATVEGLTLAAYRFTTHKSSGRGHELEAVQIHPRGEGKPAALREGIERGRQHADGAIRTRDLVNETPGNKRPPLIAERIQRDLRGSGVKVKVLDEAALEKGGYGGMLAVGQGSDAPPRLVELTYAPKSARRHVALVGKGITFDTGGINLKPWQGMTTMKMDMAGAAAVYGTVAAAAALELPVKLTGVLAFAENMPSGSAQRPSDVYTARNGKTVEVLNTDAEGRLVLSDALSHACEKDPDVVVDLATLTGAVIVALGNRISGLMSNDDDLVEELRAASERAGERLWRLPLPEDYRDDLDSEVADLKNIGKAGVAGTVIAGVFLREFVADGIPWAHLDIAGTAWSDENRHYVRKGGTGAPVRTLLHWLAAS